MNRKEYEQYVMEECKRQWHECQEETYGKWEDQSDNDKADYYDDMYSLLVDNLNKSCCDCCYLGLNDETGKWYCNCGSSDNYEKEVTENDIVDCKDFEE